MSSATGASARTFADLAAEHGPTDLIAGTSRTWGADGLADLAFIALSRTCLHPRVGRPVRNALYEWSRAARTPQTLKLVIARVCEPLGQTYPLIALTRLKHLATHGNHQVLGEVILAARALAAQGHPVEVLAAALSWCAEINREDLSSRAWLRRRRAGAMLFLELARPRSKSGLPVILDGDRTVDPSPGWRAALEICATALGTRDDAFEEVARRWLDAALYHAHVRQRIVWIFVRAATTSGVSSDPAYGRAPASRSPDTTRIMIGLVRRWATEDPTDAVRKRIKEAIVIPLTRPWWLSLLKTLYVHVRALVKAARQRY